MQQPLDEKALADEIWYWYLTAEWRSDDARNMMKFLDARKKFYGLLPSDPHCIECGIPMSGAGGAVLRFQGSAPSTFSSIICSGCERFARKHESGAEVELSMLFADVRGSTTLAEMTTTREFQALIQRFYKETSHMLVHRNSMVNRLMGDQVSALFVPRFAGKAHAKAAVEAAVELLSVTGHGRPDGPWIPVGVGVHTGTAFVGAVGSAKGVNEIAVLGSAVNLCARLSSTAAAGEVIVSEDTFRASGLPEAGWERRELELKGISGTTKVAVFKI